MAWYRAGSVTVTNGSAVVTGAGTDFVSNTSVGEAFLGPDGRAYEIVQVVSATQMILGTAFQGAGAGGQGFAVLPTQSFARDLALGAAQLLNSFAGVRDGIGQGLMNSGVAATPGLRFALDQDTGITLAGANVLGLVAGGTIGASISAGGITSPSAFINGSASVNLAIQKPYASPGYEPARLALGVAQNHVILEGGAQVDNNTPAYFAIKVMDNAGVVQERMRIDTTGSLLVGATVGSYHTISKGSTVGKSILDVAFSTTFKVCNDFGFSATGAAIYAARNTNTGRSINAAGTINASGADYAEYMTKAEGCGSIAKGDVCGIDRDGLLTRSWAAAMSFVVKSTDPSLVGGDIWAAHLPAEPTRNDDEDEAEFATRLAAWEASLEAARQCVDRIAFCGQVPVNVTGEFAVGDYIIAVANGSGIKAVAIDEAAITFDQYRRRIGKVWAVREGRAWVDVQHG